MIDGEWRSPKCDDQGRQEVVCSGVTDTAAASVVARSVTLAKDGSDWKVNLYNEAGTRITSTTIGSVNVSASSVVTFPLNCVALLGAAANTLVVRGAGTLSLIHTSPANANFPVDVTTVSGEVTEIREMISKIHAVAGSITEITIQSKGA